MYGAVEHIGLAYLAAALRAAGHEVRIIDGYAMNLPEGEVLRRAADFSPDLVGVTAEYNTYPAAIGFISKLKAGRRESPVVCLGGEHATFASEEILHEQPLIDLLARGEGEETVVELAGRIAARGDLSSIPGTYARDSQGMIIKNPGRPRIRDLDKLPFPARDVLEECRSRGIQPALSVLTSRGCQFNCSFCNANRFFRTGGGHPWGARSPKNVVDEIRELLNRFDRSQVYPIIYFIDENFVGPGRAGIERAREIAVTIIESGLKIAFEIFCRADSFDGEEETVGLLKRAGLTSALIGLESGVQKSLDVITKHTTVDQNESTISIFRKYNIITSSSGFIMFHPYSEPNELLDNAAFLLRIGHATLYNMSLRVLLYPGIRIVERVRSDGLLKPGFKHNRVDHYRFANPVVARVVESINSVPIGAIKEEDATLRYIDLTVAQVRDHLLASRAARVRLVPLDDLLAPSRQAIAELNRTSYHFFVETTRLAMNGWDDEAFSRMKDGYLRDRGQRLVDVRSAFSEFLARINEIC